MIQSINDKLLEENLISECPEDMLPDVKILTKSWQDSSKKKVKRIKSLSKIDLECHWHFLVKPHVQWLMLRCLLNVTISQVLPALSDALFTTWMCIRHEHRLELKAMTDILELQ